MAWEDKPYATVAEYRGRNTRSSSNEDSALAAELLGVSRVVDRRLGVAPAEFAPQTAVVFTCNSNRSGSLLELRDENGRQHFLRSSTTLGIDSEGDGTFDGYTLVLGTNAWLRGFPVNAATYGEPYTELQLMAGVAGASPAAWWTGVEVRITGNWGWAAVPGPIKERVIGITRELVQVHSGGPASEEQINELIVGVSGARTLMNLLEREYNYRIPAFA